MTVTESYHTGEFILSEGNGAISREPITVTGGAYPAGQVLGKITVGAAVGAAVSGNTASSGAITAAPTVSVGAKAGVYRATCIEPATNGGKFLVEDPDGIAVGVATVGAEFSGGGLTFTIADGAGDFVSGDAFTITVAAGSGAYTAHDPAATNGSAIAAAILYAPVDASAADADGLALVRLAEVNGGLLTWKSGISAGNKSAGIAALAAHDIIVR